MDNQTSQFLHWTYHYQGKDMELDELRQSLLLTTLELESTRLKAQEELKMRDDQLFLLKDLLNRVIKEKDELQEQCQRLMLDKLLLKQQQQQKLPLSGISSNIEDEPRRGNCSNNAFSSSDCEESIVSSPIPPQELPLPILVDRPLPEKGKFLQAVMKAGPLLQTLLLAGPLPQWRHPPPPLDSYEIPPPPLDIPSPSPSPTPSPPLINISACYSSISNCGRVNRKRSFFQGSDSSSTEANKYQRLVLQ